jgi:tetratricopeptide (TPR) repeat protein
MLTKIALIIANVILVYIFAGFFVADMLSKNIDSQVKNLEFEKALNSANMSITTNPNEPYYYRQKAKVLLLLSAQSKEDKKIYKQQALLSLQKAYELNPDNLATMRNSVPYYYFLAKEDLTTQQDPLVSVVVDEDFINKTVLFYREIKARFNTDAGAIATIAKYEKMLGLTQDYDESINRLKVLRPDLLEWYPGIAY